MPYLTGCRYLEWELCNLYGYCKYLAGYTMDTSSSLKVKVKSNVMQLEQL